MDSREATARRVKAAQALGGFSNAGALASATKGLGNLGLKRIRELQQQRGNEARVVELRTIAEACGLPYEFFTADFGSLTHVATPEEFREVQEQVRELARQLAEMTPADATREAITASRAVTRAAQARAVGDPSTTEAAGGTRGSEGASEEPDQARREAKP